MKFFEPFIKKIMNPRSDLSRLSISSEDLGESAAYATAARFNMRAFLRSGQLVFGCAVIIILVVIVFLGPLLGAYDPFITSRSLVPHYDAELGEIVKGPFPPSLEYPLGTDRWGNDILSLILYGARVTLITTAYITLARILVGTILGTFAGWKAEALIDRVVTGLVSIASSIPILLSSLILILALNIEKGAIVFIVALSLPGWTEVAQLVRSEVLRIRKMLYIEAAESIGLTKPQIVVRHVLPNLLSLLLVVIFLEMSAVLLLLAELGFLGIFIGGGSHFKTDPFSPEVIQLAEVPEWGALIAQGVPYIRSHTFLVLGPALPFFISIMGLNAFGEGLRRFLGRGSVNTAFLLKKRMLAIVAIVAVGSFFILGLTGPQASYTRVAKSFNATEVSQHTAVLTQCTGLDCAQYIADIFKKYEVGRGWTKAFTSKYIFTTETSESTTLKGESKPEADSPPEGDAESSNLYFPLVMNSSAMDSNAVPPGMREAHHVIGFFGGYDLQIAEQLVVLVTPRDSASTGLALELVRSWHREKLDPRRTMLFITWDGTQDELLAYLKNPENYKFTPKVPTDPPRPAIVIQVGESNGDENTYAVSSASDQKLFDILSESAKQVNASFNLESQPMEIQLLQKIPYLYLEWPDSKKQPSTDLAQDTGEMLSLALIKILRQPEY